MPPRAMDPSSPKESEASRALHRASARPVHGFKFVGVGFVKGMRAHQREVQESDKAPASGVPRMRAHLMTRTGRGGCRSEGGHVAMEASRKVTLLLALSSLGHLTL